MSQSLEKAVKKTGMYEKVKQLKEQLVTQVEMLSV